MTKFTTISKHSKRIPWLTADFIIHHSFFFIL
jgi:hypothetical protein